LLETRHGILEKEWTRIIGQVCDGLSNGLPALYSAAKRFAFVQRVSVGIEKMEHRQEAVFAMQNGSP
jgi:hypothetical protein